MVRDGHHRISVARTLGLAEIDAVVTAWELATRSLQAQGQLSTVRPQ